MKMFCKSLREHVMEIINFKKETMKLLTKQQQKMKNQKSVIFVRKNLKINMRKIKNIAKLDIIVIQGNMEVLRIA